MSINLNSLMEEDTRQGRLLGGGDAWAQSKRMSRRYPGKEKEIYANKRRSIDYVMRTHRSPENHTLRACKQEGCSRMHCEMAQWIHGWHCVMLFLPFHWGLHENFPLWLRNQDSKCICHTRCKITPCGCCFFTFPSSSLKSRQGGVYGQLSWTIHSCLAAREAGKMSIVHF